MFEAMAWWKSRTATYDGHGAGHYTRTETFASRAAADRWALHQVEALGAHYATVNPAEDAETAGQDAGEEVHHV